MELRAAGGGPTFIEEKKAEDPWPPRLGIKKEVAEEEELQKEHMAFLVVNRPGGSKKNVEDHESERRQVVPRTIEEGGSVGRRKHLQNSAALFQTCKIARLTAGQKKRRQAAQRVHAN